MIKNGTLRIMEGVAMKKNLLFLFSVNVLLLAALFSAGTAAGEGASVEKGKMLFNSPELGTTGSSCNTCHAGGRGLEYTANKKQWITEGTAHDTLEGAVNYFITKALHGKPLDVKSTEMQSLVLYIKSLGEKMPEMQMKPSVGC